MIPHPDSTECLSEKLIAIEKGPDVSLEALCDQCYFKTDRCFLCKKGPFSNRVLLEYHLEKCHPEVDPPSYQCNRRTSMNTTCPNYRHVIRDRIFNPLGYTMSTVAFPEKCIFIWFALRQLFTPFEVRGEIISHCLEESPYYKISLSCDGKLFSLSIEKEATFYDLKTKYLKLLFETTAITRPESDFIGSIFVVNGRKMEYQCSSVQMKEYGIRNGLCVFFIFG